MHNVIEDSRLARVDAGDVFRAMGYPDTASVSAPVRELSLAQLDHLDELCEPWAGSREVGITAIAADAVHLESGRSLRSARLARVLRRARSVEICLVTLGPRVPAEVNRLMAEGSMLEALALDAAGSAAASALMAGLQARVCREAHDRKCGTTLPYSPGYTGWSVRDTPVLFSLLEEATLPVRLNEQLMMVPAKSLVGVIGLIPGGPSAPREVVPCRLCDLERCSVRRSPYRAGPSR